MWHYVDLALTTSQKAIFFIVTAVKTSNLTYLIFDGVNKNISSETFQKIQVVRYGYLHANKV
jgi:hypothetical protein